MRIRDLLPKCEGPYEYIFIHEIHPVRRSLTTWLIARIIRGDAPYEVHLAQGKYIGRGEA